MKETSYNKKEGILNISWLSTHLIMVYVLNLRIRLSTFSFIIHYHLNNKIISRMMIMINEMIKKSFLFIISPPFLEESTQLLIFPKKILTFTKSKNNKIQIILRK